MGIEWNQYIAEEFILFLREMKTDEQRLQALQMVTETVCQYCGKMQDYERCQCWNDE